MPDSTLISPLTVNELASGVELHADASNTTDTADASTLE
ncbi:hypothetical protein Barb7_01636 [Bacteroidales bacterium Barb7]|nr:hypothetical protein Barb7_01636 [Bacteroidales bacterium Barb7]